MTAVAAPIPRLAPVMMMGRVIVSAISAKYRRSLAEAAHPCAPGGTQVEAKLIAWLGCTRSARTRRAPGCAAVVLFPPDPCSAPPHHRPGAGAWGFRAHAHSR